MMLKSPIYKRILRRGASLTRSAGHIKLAGPEPFRPSGFLSRASLPALRRQCGQGCDVGLANRVINDLVPRSFGVRHDLFCRAYFGARDAQPPAARSSLPQLVTLIRDATRRPFWQIGRASVRERGCEYG